MPVIYDITPPVTADLKVWPGDTPPSREVLLDMRQGDNITLSTLHATVHLGAHADGPNHYSAAAPSIDQRPLDLYIGPCQVVRVTAPAGSRLRPDQLPEVTAPRVLIATDSFPDPAVFNEDFVALAPELLDALAACGVRLVGVDTPSVDTFDSKDLPAHAALLRHDLAVLEGLVLTDVPAGEYELIALPLKLVGFDASPVRAILRSLD